MVQQFRVLLVDDGELDDVRDCLLALGVDFAHLRGGAVPAQIEPPTDLLVASPRRASLARPWPAHGRPVRIAVVNEDSGALRSSLRGMGFTYLVRRPVHPVALRLLLLHALYSGDERRTRPRVPLGHRVVVKVGMRRRPALLADLSEGGCRLLLHEPVSEGARIVVQVGGEQSEDEGFSLPGRVVRCESDRSSPADGAWAAAVRFRHLSEDARELVDAALAAHRIKGDGSDAETDATAVPGAGPLPIPFERDEPAPRLVRRMPTPRTVHAAPPPRDRAAHAERRDRRRVGRGLYPRRVIAATAQGGLHRVLIGRDLSSRGMRVDRHADLSVGSTLRLALYDPTREAPIVTEAKVTRDDAEGGLALTFVGLSAEVCEHLDQLVAALPPVECLDDGETGALGTVVSEIL